MYEIVYLVVNRMEEMYNVLVLREKYIYRVEV
jgi:hypothetical protein